MRQHRPTDAPGGLLELSELSLSDLDGLEPSALTSVLHDLLDPSQYGADPVAGFQSYLDPDLDA
jgi:FXSXX-COOH protein